MTNPAKEATFISIGAGVGAFVGSLGGPKTCKICAKGGAKLGKWLANRA